MSSNLTCTMSKFKSRMGLSGVEGRRNKCEILQFCMDQLSPFLLRGRCMNICTSTATDNIYTGPGHHAKLSTRRTVHVLRQSREQTRSRPRRRAFISRKAQTRRRRPANVDARITFSHPVHGWFRFRATRGPASRAGVFLSGGGVVCLIASLVALQPLLIACCLAVSE